jgi:hypothetical protein
MIKARIAPGYPKIAQYTGKSYEQSDPHRRTYYFPSSYLYRYGDIPYRMTHGEPIIIVNENWRAGQYHFIPLKLLEEKRVPLNVILTWTSSHTKLAKLVDTEFVLL